MRWRHYASAEKPTGARSFAAVNMHEDYLGLSKGSPDVGTDLYDQLVSGRVRMRTTQARVIIVKLPVVLARFSSGAAKKVQCQFYVLASRIILSSTAHLRPTPLKGTPYLYRIMHGARLGLELTVIGECLHVQAMRSSPHIAYKHAHEASNVRDISLSSALHAVAV
jgi:hypothetical protein